MRIEGLVTRIRGEFLDDDRGNRESQFIWKTPQIVNALSLAERDLCKRCHLLNDSTTADICRITIAATDGVYPRTVAHDARVLRIQRLKFPGVTTPLTQKNITWLDANDPGWDEKSGTPTHFAVDGDSCAITFNRQPLAGGVVLMTVKRLPLVPINEKDATQSPEVKNLDDELIHGALKYLFSKPDLEGYDPNLADKWDRQFERDIKQITQDQAALNPQELVCKPERF